MSDVIQSTDFDEVYDAMLSSQVTLENVEARFVDLKTSFQQGTQSMEFNDRNKDKQSCWLELTDAERQQVVEGCSFSAFDNPIERWIAYSLQPQFALMRNGSLWNHYAIDCDGSKSAEIVPAAINALYQALWHDVPADSGDTMNSFWTTYKQALIVMGHADWQSSAKCGILAEMIDEEGRLRPEFCAENDCGQRVAEYYLQMLAYLTHTIGNFIPCAGPFNSGRYALTCDYWDITLEYVRDWYINRQNIEIGSNVPNASFNTGTLVACRDWLDHFGDGVEGWNAFVEDNYLQAYIETSPEKGPGSCGFVQDNQGAYVVRPFFPSHGFDHKLPEDPMGLAFCLRHMIAAIIARGNQMVEKLGDDPCAKLFVK